MLSKRIIACLGVRDGHVVKGVKFEGLRSAGDPAELARRYNVEGIDELVILDITATIEARRAPQDGENQETELVLQGAELGAQSADLFVVLRFQRAVGLALVVELRLELF